MIRERLPIIYEDRYLIGVDKPSGLLSISTPYEKDKTMYHYVSEYLKRRWGRNSRVFVVHRLDKDTSGVMVFAKDFETKNRLQDLFERGEVERRYQAILSHIPENREDTIVRYLNMDRMGNVYISSPRDKEAKKAITEYRIVKTKGSTAYADIRILTGRKNQIRISFADIGCPIIGDKKYASASHFRLMLNANLLDLRALYDKPDYVLKSEIDIFR